MRFMFGSKHPEKQFVLPDEANRLKNRDSDKIQHRLFRNTITGYSREKRSGECSSPASAKESREEQPARAPEH